MGKVFEMKIIELRKYLQENDFLSDSYSLEGGLPSEALCIERTKNNWRVYYSERGKKNEFGIFANEEDAVKCFWHILSDYQKWVK